MISEENTYKPSNWYDIGKIAVELILKMKTDPYNSISNPKGYYIIFRIPLIFGPIKTGYNKQLLYSIVIRMFRNEDFYFEVGMSEAEKYGTSWVDGRDLARAIVDSLDDTVSGIYNIQSGFITWIELIEMIKGIIGSKSKIITNSRNVIPNGYRLPHSISKLDTNKITSLKKFSPKYTINDTILDYLAFNDFGVNSLWSLPQG
jgi:nucleoside-diphosphate-sugar epimerase